MCFSRIKNYVAKLKNKFYKKKLKNVKVEIFSLFFNIKKSPNFLGDFYGKNYFSIELI